MARNPTVRPRLGLRPRKESAPSVEVSQVGGEIQLCGTKQQILNHVGKGDEVMEAMLMGMLLAMRSFGTTCLAVPLKEDTDHEKITISVSSKLVTITK